MKQLFASKRDVVLSLFALTLLGYLAASMFNFIFFTGEWGVVTENVHLFAVGSYPAEEIWRPIVSFGFFCALIAVSMLLRAREVAFKPIIKLWTATFVVCGGLLYGIPGISWLPIVETRLWGGFLLTVVVTISGILSCFPLSVALAFGRRSALPAVSWLCTGFIELVRGVPMVTLLFMGQIIIPLFLPASMVVSNLTRIMIAVTIFAAAYMAEYIRGGLQAIPRGQREAAHALGLHPLQTNVLILLPQAIKAVIPALVGQCISLFKDTALVAIVGLLDLTGAARAAIGQPEFIGLEAETYFAIGVIYWIFSKAMAQYSRGLERRLGVGERY